MAAPQALTPAQIQQIIAAGRGNTVNIGGTLYGANYADTGSGETLQEGALQGITGSTGIDQAGQPFYSYNPTGALTGQGTTKASQSFFGGLGDALSDPVVIAALLGGAGAAGMFGGAAAGAAGTAGMTAAELAQLDLALGGAGGTLGGQTLAAGLTTGAAIPTLTNLTGGSGVLTGAAGGITAESVAAKLAADAGVTTAQLTAAASSTGLTTAQIANLLKAGISVAGLVGAGNAVSNMGGGGTTPAGVSIPTQGTPQYNADYYSRVQGAYNQALPGMPRDVVSNLAAWYGGDSGMMSGTDTANTAVANQVVKPVVPPKIPAKLVDPMTNLMNAYRSGDVAKTKQALIGALNEGMTTEQLMSTFNIDMTGIDSLRRQGYYLPAMTSEIQGVVANEMKNPVTAYQNIVARMDATGTNPAAVAAAMNIPVAEIQNAYNQLNPTGLFANNNPNFGAVDAGTIYNLAANPTDYETAIQEIQQYRAADEVGQQSVVERALAAELAARPGSSLSALQQAGSTYGVSAADIAAAYAKLGYA